MEGIVVVECIDFICIAVEDILIVDIAKANTEAALIHLAYAHHFSLSRYPLFSLVAAEVLCNISHHGLLIDESYSIN